MNIRQEQNTALRLLQGHLHRQRRVVQPGRIADFDDTLHLRRPLALGDEQCQRLHQAAPPATCGADKNHVTIFRQRQQGGEIAQQIFTVVQGRQLALFGLLHPIRRRAALAHHTLDDQAGERRRGDAAALQQAGRADTRL